MKSDGPATVRAFFIGGSMYRNLEVYESEIVALKAILEYLEGAEETDYACSAQTEEEPRHIAISLRHLRALLDRMEY